MPDWTSKQPTLLGVSLRQPPSNPQAEQGLLGALLANNRAYERVSEFLVPEHFADPIHGRIYKAIVRRIEAGQLADTVTLKTDLENSGALEEVGGPTYLAKLLTAMVGIINASEYGRSIYDAWVRRQLIDIGETVVNNAFGDADHSGPQQIEAAEQALFVLGVGDSADGDAPVSVAEAMVAAIEEGELVRQGRGQKHGSTGLPSLDERTLGLRPGHLTVAAGRPGMGKSSLARSLALNVAGGLGITQNGEIVDNQELGLPVLYFSLEETALDFGAACASQLSNVPVKYILDGSVSNDEADRLVMATRRVADMPLHIFQKPRQSLRSITTKARRARRKIGPIGLVVVDYLQLMADPPGFSEKRLAVGQNIYGLKELAKELGCAVVALSQLSRKVEDRGDKRPTMSDLRETGEIEDAADVICLLFRAEYYHRQKAPDPMDAIEFAQWNAELAAIAGKAEVIVPKVRRGEPGVVQLHFNGSAMRFEEPRL